MNSILKLALLVSVVATLNGCYYDKESDLYPNSYCDMTVYSYSGAIKSIMTTNCATTNCHVTGATAPDLSTYDGVFAAKDRVIFRACTQKNMPSSAPISNCAMAKLQKWVSAGALNN